MIYGRIQLYIGCTFDKNGVDLPIINAADVSQEYDGIMQYSGATPCGEAIPLETPFNPEQSILYFRAPNDGSGGDFPVTAEKIFSCNYMSVRLCVPSESGFGEEIKTYFYFIDSVEIAASDEQAASGADTLNVSSFTFVTNITRDEWATDVLTKNGIGAGIADGTHIDGASVERLTPPNDSMNNGTTPNGFYIATGAMIPPSGMTDNAAKGMAKKISLDFPFELEPVKAQSLTTFAADNTAGLTSSLYSVVAVVTITDETAGGFGSSVVALTTSTLLTAKQATGAIYTISSAKNITYHEGGESTSIGIQLQKLYVVPAILSDGKTIPKDNTKNFSFSALSVEFPIVNVNPIASTGQDVLTVKSYLTYRIAGLSNESNRQLSAFVLDKDNRQYYTTIGTLYHRAKLPSSPELYPLSGGSRMVCVAPYVTIDVNGAGGGICLKLWTDSENFVDITEDFSVNFPTNSEAEAETQDGIQKAIQGLAGGVGVAGGIAQLLTGNAVGGISALVSGAGAVINAVSPESKKTFGGGAGAGVINAFKAGGVYLESGRAGNADRLKEEIGRRGYVCNGDTYSDPIFFMKDGGKGDAFFYLQCSGGTIAFSQSESGAEITPRGKTFIRNALTRGARFWRSLSLFEQENRGKTLCNGEII